MRRNVAGQVIRFSLFKSGARIAAPTIAVGDFTVDKDGAGQVNVATPPTSDAAGLVTWLPSQAETDASVVTFLGNDVLGAQWEPLTISFDTFLDSLVELNLDRTISSRAAPGEAMTLTAAADTSIATAVWNFATRTLTSLSTLVSSIAAAVWTYVTRTLTTPAGTLPGSTNTDIVLYKYSNNTVTISSIVVSAARTALYFTLKSSNDDADADSRVQITEAAGLTVLNGAATTAAWGSIVVAVGLDSVAVTLLDHAAGALAPGHYTWDLKQILAAGAAVPLASGSCTVYRVATWAVV